MENISGGEPRTARLSDLKQLERLSKLPEGFGDALNSSRETLMMRGARFWHRDSLDALLSHALICIILEYASGGDVYQYVGELVVRDVASCDTTLKKDSMQT